MSFSFGKWFQPVVAASSAALVLLAGLLDQWAGGSFSLVLLYLCPISLAAWFGSRWAGWGVAGLSTVAWLTNSLQRHTEHDYTPAFYWAVFQVMALFFVAGTLLGAMRRALQRERETARTDYLTGAPNARAFYERLEQEVAAQHRYRRPLTLVYVDIDNFKLINDRFGHSVGDDVLRAVFDCIKKNVRATDFPARLGGDEFTVILPDSGREAAQILARRLAAKLAEEMEQAEWLATFSIGMVTCAAPPPSVEDLVQAADRLMYQVKNRGKNSIRHEIFSAPPTKRLDEWDQPEDRTA